MEHCQFITQENAEKSKELGITLSMQPNFNSDSIQYTDRIAEVYCNNNNPFRMLIDKVGFIPGEDLIFGSDGMPHGAQYALEQTLFPPVPGQALSLEEFVAGYCMPDKENGYVDIEIDEEKQSVTTRVILTAD
jgi:predicted amidohydrolase YtcJ